MGWKPKEAQRQPYAVGWSFPVPETANIVYGGGLRRKEDYHLLMLLVKPY